jgi:subtilisin family serine protease
MVAWQALMELGNQVQVELFVTLGSPLGLPQVRGELKKWHGKNLPIPPGVKRRINVARNGDIVCADKTLAGEYTRTGLNVEDFLIQDWALMPKAHDAAYYLSYGVTREAVHASVDTARFQPISGFAVARDLTETLDQAPDRREPVLIELTDRASGPAPIQTGDLLEEARSSVASWIRTHVCNADVSDEDIQLDVLHRYVSVHLTRDEIERLAVQMGQSYGSKAPGVYRIYKNSRKKALATAADLQPGLATIHAPTAHLGYNARGRGITWAVLDTGIDQGHPHFDTATGKSIVAAWDCTRLGAPRPADPIRDLDPNGHGTHVAGIIAGKPDPAKYPVLGGISSSAPDARLVTYKVLANDGSGNDAWIIKAIDHIWEQNERARRLVIHGANLSLGGPFDATSFGCGDSPLCASLLRLIRQGVLVVLAAGNEGIGEVLVDGNPTSLSLDLSIGDPANLEEGIAVGSIHPSLPHRYGTSYFSSRGPTADGRAKPDVVAPGERILSCRSRRTDSIPPDVTVQDLYVQLSGTSMAAPHVSGLLAAFLSARTEFIGYPERVKRILTDHCTDLKRDRYHQGAGVPNLTRMLLQG